MSGTIVMEEAQGVGADVFYQAEPSATPRTARDVYEWSVQKTKEMNRGGLTRNAILTAVIGAVILYALSKG